jgi:hypothetical protein
LPSEQTIHDEVMDFMLSKRTPEQALAMLTKKGCGIGSTEIASSR